MPESDNQGGVATRTLSSSIVSTRARKSAGAVASGCSVVCSGVRRSGPERTLLPPSGQGTFSPVRLQPYAHDLPSAVCDGHDRSASLAASLDPAADASCGAIESPMPARTASPPEKRPRGEGSVSSSVDSPCHQRGAVLVVVHKRLRFSRVTPGLFASRSGSDWREQFDGRYIRCCLLRRQRLSSGATFHMSSQYNFSSI